MSYSTWVKISAARSQVSWLGADSLSPICLAQNQRLDWLHGNRVPVTKREAISMLTDVNATGSVSVKFTLKLLGFERQSLSLNDSIALLNVIIQRNIFPIKE